MCQISLVKEGVCGSLHCSFKDLCSGPLCQVVWPRSPLPAWVRRRSCCNAHALSTKVHSRSESINRNLLLFLCAAHLAAQQLGAAAQVPEHLDEARHRARACVTIRHGVNSLASMMPLVLVLEAERCSASRHRGLAAKQGDALLTWRLTHCCLGEPKVPASQFRAICRSLIDVNLSDWTQSLVRVHRQPMDMDASSVQVPLGSICRTLQPYDS